MWLYWNLDDVGSSTTCISQFGLMKPLDGSVEIFVKADSVLVDVTAACCWEIISCLEGLYKDTLSHDLTMQSFRPLGNLSTFISR